MLSEIILLSIVIVGGGAFISFILYLIFKKNLTVKLWLWLLPGISLLVADVYFWALFGGVKNLFLTSVQVPTGLLLLIGNFTLVGKTLSNRIGYISEELYRSTDVMTSASNEVSTASQFLAEGASEQAASLEETSSALEEMATMTKHNADNAGQASSLSDETKSTTENCSNAMQEMAKAIEQVDESSQETQKIVKTIDEIAFQTNLLALNAAVEAARAGEAGAGFAVVADEVRSLATRAADAAKSTTTQIDDISRKISEAQEMVFKSIDEFIKVDENTGKVNELVAEIAAASNEQAQGVEQVNRAVTEMDRVVQQNAANAEESASASKEMYAQAESMRGMVKNLVAIVRGDQSPGTAEKVTPEYSSVKIAPSRTEIYSSEKNEREMVVQ